MVSESQQHYIRPLMLALFTMCLSLSAGAQVLRDSVELNFRQSKTQLDSTYMDNAAALRHARQMIELYHRPDSNFVLKDMHVEGGASPEGSVGFNDRLSRRRADRIFETAGRALSGDKAPVSYAFLGRDWKGLRRMVETDSDVPYRSEVLALLAAAGSDSLSAADSDRLLSRIKRLRHGEPYLYMYHNLFPSLRASKLILTFGNRLRPFDIPASLILPPVATIGNGQPMVNFVAAPAKKPIYIGLKTNMLFDILAVPNVGADFYVGKNMSVVGNWMYGWWDTDRTHRYWRIYGGDLGLRWWFGSAAHRKPLTGHHIGLYGGVVTYDFEFGGRGYMGGLPGRPLWARCNWYGGVEYGFSLPVARRLNIDFTLGMGILAGKYIVYDPEDGYYVWKETHKRRWIGPTKLEISLVWLVGRGNVNKRKGEHHE